MRTLKKLSIFIFLIIFCTETNKEYRYNNVIVGGPCEIRFYTMNESAGKNNLREIDIELKRLDSLLSYFSPHSFVSLINKRHHACIPPDIKDLFILSDFLLNLQCLSLEIPLLWG